jgi:hypothetical protein
VWPDTVRQRHRISAKAGGSRRRVRRPGDGHRLHVLISDILRSTSGADVELRIDRPSNATVIRLVQAQEGEEYRLLMPPRLSD